MIRYLEGEVRRLSLGDAAWFAQLFHQSVLEAAAEAGVRPELAHLRTPASADIARILSRRRPPLTPSR